MYHLLLLLERLQRGDVGRTDMDAFHSLLYKHNYATTAEDWKCMLDPQKTFIFYDGFCVSREKRGEEFRAIPEFIMEVHQELKRRDFLTPWCNAPADAEIIFVRTSLLTLVTRLLHSLNFLCTHRLHMSGFLGLILIRTEIS